MIYDTTVCTSSDIGSRCGITAPNRLLTYKIEDEQMSFRKQRGWRYILHIKRNNNAYYNGQVLSIWDVI